MNSPDASAARAAAAARLLGAHDRGQPCAPVRDLVAPDDLAGDVLLSGALGPMVPAAPGAVFEAQVQGLGSVRARFAG